MIKVVICLFGEKVKENSNKFLSHLACSVGKSFPTNPSSGRGKGEGERRELFFFY